MSGQWKEACQAEHFRFVWDGARVKSVYSFDKVGTIKAEDLFKDATAQGRLSTRLGDYDPI